MRFCNNCKQYPKEPGIEDKKCFAACYDIKDRGVAQMKPSALGCVRMAVLARQMAESRRSDTERLEWLVERGAQVLYTRDEEFCWVEYYYDDEKIVSENYYNWRAAIDSLMDFSDETVNIYRVGDGSF